ncbi:MAG: PepSY-associated TM helix domain-containing protein [Saprospiraceae bacterium]|nr:PepSY-associated TM helix domain-containing protein [Saprospiraceae bacterium]
MKKSKLIKLHLYCGLFTSFYILIFGISSIIINHKLDVDHKEITAHLTKQVNVDKDLTDDKLAENIRDQLRMMGWLPRWQMQRDSQNFKFTVVHLAKTNQLSVDLNTGETSIDVIPKGLLATINGLHFFGGNMPNAPFIIKTWKIYQYSALLVLFISLILGLWLWIKFSYRTWELYFFGGLFFFTIIIMALL